MDAHIVQRIALFMPALLLSLAVHEFAHAWVATKLGDTTPTRQGRLTLSPVSHIDPFGSLVMPLLLLVSSGMVFGWAKPVEFQPANFTRKVSMRRGIALTAVAGPLSNVLLALLAILLLRFGLEFGWAAPAGQGPERAVMVFRFLEGLFTLNVLLAVFNLFPLPPLDGHYLLPRSLDSLTDWLRRYSFVLFLGLFFLPIPALGGTLGMFLMRPFIEILQRLLLSVAVLGT